MPGDVGAECSSIALVIDLCDRGGEPAFDVVEVFVAGWERVGGDENGPQVGADLSWEPFVDCFVGEWVCIASDFGDDGSDGRRALEPSQGPRRVACQEGGVEGSEFGAEQSAWTAKQSVDLLITGASSAESVAVQVLDDPAQGACSER